MRIAAIAFISFCVGTLLTFIGLYAASLLGHLSTFPASDKQIELETLFLAAATLAVTAAAVVIALFGIVGYTTIRKAAIEAGRLAGAIAGEKAIAPILQRERMVRFAEPERAAPEGLDPLTTELAAGRDQ